MNFLQFLNEAKEPGDLVYKGVLYDTHTWVIVDYKDIEFILYFTEAPAYKGTPGAIEFIRCNINDRKDHSLSIKDADHISNIITSTGIGEKIAKEISDTKKVSLVNSYAVGRSSFVLTSNLDKALEIRKEDSPNLVKAPKHDKEASKIVERIAKKLFNKLLSVIKIDFNKTQTKSFDGNNIFNKHGNLVAGIPVTIKLSGGGTKSGVTEENAIEVEDDEIVISWVPTGGTARWAHEYQIVKLNGKPYSSYKAELHKKFL